jgi:hypothetical protein
VLAQGAVGDRQRLGEGQRRRAVEDGAQRARDKLVVVQLPGPVQLVAGIRRRRAPPPENGDVHERRCRDLVQTDQGGG